MKLNFVFVKPNSFPKGFAMSKRHKYIVDYLNEFGITSALMQTRETNNIFSNPRKGVYGLSRYVNLGYLWENGVFGKLHYYKEGLKNINDFFIENKINILIFPSLIPLDAMPFYFYARWKNYKIVFDVVENYSVNGGDSSIYFRLSHWFTCMFYKKAMGIFCISKRIEDFLHEIAPSTPVRILLNSSPQSSIINKNKFSAPIRLLYTGTFAPKDGLDFFLTCYVEFLRKSTISTKLVLTGTGSDNNLNKVLNKIKSIDNIEFKGFVSDKELKSLISDSDILLMTRCNTPFANYGFPFKLSEYLSSGNTVLTTAVGDVPLYLKHRVNAYIVEPDNMEQMMEALEFLVSHEKESIAIGRNGSIVAKEIFDVRKNGEKFINFMRECLDQDL